MKNFSRDEQMAQLKNGVITQTKTNFPKSDQSEVSEKVRKEKK